MNNGSYVKNRSTSPTTGQGRLGSFVQSADPYWKSRVMNSSRTKSLYKPPPPKQIINPTIKPLSPAISRPAIWR